MNRPLRIGGPAFNCPDDIGKQVAFHLEHGWAAAFCPFIEDKARREEHKAAFREADIALSEFGAYCINVLDTDPVKAQEHFDAICRHLAYADEMEALCCVIHCGTIETGGWGKSNPENISPVTFERNVTALRAILDKVKPQRAKLTLELNSWLLPYNAASYVALLGAVDRPALGVHLDPQNILDSPTACYRSAEIIRECFTTLGPKIVSCHSKDIVLKSVYLPIEITESYTGDGLVDHGEYLRQLAALDHDAPLMIEHLMPEQLPAANRCLFDKAAELGLAVRNGEKRTAN